MTTGGGIYNASLRRAIADRSTGQPAQIKPFVSARANLLRACLTALADEPARPWVHPFVLKPWRTSVKRHATHEGSPRESCPACAAATTGRPQAAV